MMQFQHYHSFNQTNDLINQPFVHDALYQFWARSQGLWFSKLVKVAVRFLEAHELPEVGKIYGVNDNIEFGVRMQWEYYTKAKAGQMSWCVDTAHPNMIFTERFVTHEEPQVLHYTMPSSDELTTRIGNVEERFYLQNHHRRLRELRQDGRLLRRLWEHKFSP